MYRVRQKILAEFASQSEGRQIMAKEATENKKAKSSNLDKSIDLGMDQFGRFVKLRWVWLVLLGIVMWYVVAYIVPQLSPPSPGSVLQYAFQIAFAIFFGI